MTITADTVGDTWWIGWGAGSQGGGDTRSSFGSTEGVSRVFRGALGVPRLGSLGGDIFRVAGRSGASSGARCRGNRSRLDAWGDTGRPLWSSMVVLTGKMVTKAKMYQHVGIPCFPTNTFLLFIMCYWMQLLLNDRMISNATVTHTVLCTYIIFLHLQADIDAGTSLLAWLPWCRPCGKERRWSWKCSIMVKGMKCVKCWWSVMEFVGNWMKMMDILQWEATDNLSSPASCISLCITRCVLSKPEKRSAVSHEKTSGGRVDARCLTLGKAFTCLHHYGILCHPIPSNTIQYPIPLDGFSQTLSFFCWVDEWPAKTSTCRESTSHFPVPSDCLYGSMAPLPAPAAGRKIPMSKDQRLRHISPTHIGIPWSITFSAHVHHILVTFNVDTFVLQFSSKSCWVSIWTLWRAAKRVPTEGFLWRVACIKGFSQKNSRSFAASWNVSQGPRLICLCWRLEKTGSCAGFKKVSPRYGNPTMQVQHGWRSKMLWLPWCDDDVIVLSEAMCFLRSATRPKTLRYWDAACFHVPNLQLLANYVRDATGHSTNPKSFHGFRPESDMSRHRTVLLCVCVCGEGYGSQCGIHAEMFTSGLFSSVEHPRISRAGVSTPRFKVTWLAAHGPNQKRVVMKRCFPDCSFRGRGANRCAAWWYLMVLDGWIPHLRWCTEHEISLLWCVKVQLPGVVSSGDVLLSLLVNLVSH